MRITKLYIRLFLMSTLLLSFLLFTPISTQANQNNINVILSNSKNDICIEGADVTLYELATFTDYKLRTYDVNEAYESIMSKLDFSTAKVGCTEENAKKVQKYVHRNKLTGISGKTNKDGKAVFENVKIGIYYVEVDAGKDYSVDPFLIEVPLYEDGEYVFNIKAEPKIEVLNKNGGNGKGNDITNHGNKLPQTGQLKWPVPVMMILGITFVVAGYADYCFKGKKKNES